MDDTWRQVGAEAYKTRFQPQAGVEIKIETVSPKAKNRKNELKRKKGSQRKTEAVDVQNETKQKNKFAGKTVQNYQAKFEIKMDFQKPDKWKF